MLKDLDTFTKNIKGKIRLNYNLKNHTWLNIGGNAKIFFVPETLAELREFLVYLKKNNNDFFLLGAGSNLLISENIQNRIFIKLGKNFNKISLMNDNIVIAGCSILDKNVSDFATNNNLSGLEFLSCIPGSVGGAIIMNSGCYGEEISDILISIKVIDLKGNIQEIKKDKINFIYRGTNLPKDLIILSAKFHAKQGDKNLINNKIKKYIKEKKDAQPSQIKTCGSTFKNPKNKKAWELIKNSNGNLLSFGKASISKKHSNFFVNEGGASSNDIEKLIYFVRQNVFEKYKINLDLELKIIGENIDNE